VPTPCATVPAPSTTRQAVVLLQILGIASESHDSGIALIENGAPLIILEEERLIREKHTLQFPLQSLKIAFDEAARSIQDVDVITTPWDVQKIRRTFFKATTGNFPASLNLLWPSAHTTQDGGIVFLNMWMRRDLKKHFRGARLPSIVNVGHHDSHAAIYFASPFEDASVLVMDGYGDDAATSAYTGAGNRLTRHWQGKFFDSLGMVYTLITQHLGFRPFEEGTVMALAACGAKTYVEKMRDIVRLEADGRFSINMAYFSYDSYGMRRPFKRLFLDTFGPARAHGAPLTDHHRDLARALQTVTEEIVLHVARGIGKAHPSRNLCFTGGVALNCVANARILQDTDFQRVWVPPCASDTGAPLGSALWHYHQTLGKPRSYTMKDAFYGSEYNDDQIKRAFERSGIAYERLEYDELIARVARNLADKKIVGWFQGRFEIGPRALGNRSILASPLNLDIKDIINTRIKHREPFRPFAPAVLQEYAADYFEIDQPDPFMTLAPRVKPDKLSVIPAAVHVDGTARIQTVDRAANPRYYDVIKAFMALTGVPVLLNTSFNKQEPIVARPEEAIACYLRTDMDVVAIGNFYSTDRNPRAVADARAAHKLVEANLQGGE
jgi:carbamoyltransferase